MKSQSLTFSGIMMYIFSIHTWVMVEGGFSYCTWEMTGILITVIGRRAIFKFFVSILIWSIELLTFPMGGF